jgi:hypothetical protein
MTRYEDTENLPNILVTGVGSLPHTDPDAAVELIMDTLPTAPHCPQLSAADPREQMWIQYSEGLPRFRVDLENLTYHFDTSGDYLQELEQFYAGYLQVTDGGSAQDFAVSHDFGRGIHAFLEKLNARGKRYPFVKVQVTGPLSFGLTVTDQGGKPIFYDDTFRDVAVKGMGLKAAWLVQTFSRFADRVIIFLDEPSLSAYGSSAFLGLSKDAVIESLDEVIAIILAQGGIPGIHCCGNTDWGMLMETTARIINFDAVDYLESLTIYARELRGFIDRGGVLAWGAVPNTEQVEHESVENVVRRMDQGLTTLESCGLDREALTEHMLITPACGCAGLSVTQTQKAYELLGELDRHFGENRFRT